MDQQAALGVATTRLEERVAASLGQLAAAPIRFEAAHDVPQAGVLAALPALLALGLLRHSAEHFALPPGYYPLETVFLSIAFLALARVPSLEALRYEPPGEWGRLLGLDRIPEVRTLRDKLGVLCAAGAPVRAWSSTLAREWMAAQPQSVGTLYIDGHVRVYHGQLTQLPRRYVARQRLCLRGTTDYWVNAMDGAPFFAVTQAADPGLLQTLEEQIVPRLLTEVPGQPTEAELKADPWRARFTLVFDRAGYSPDFFQRRWAQRIAVLTYHKFPEAEWPAEEFTSRKVRLVSGEEVELALAERGVRLRNGFWVREVRQREESGHQVSMLASDFRRDLSGVAVGLFARWCQENFFQYMGRHYGLDRLIEYGTEPLPEATVVVNPDWRRLDQTVRRARAVLARTPAQFGALSLPAAAEPEAAARHEQQKGQLLEQIAQQESQWTEWKRQRKETPRHLPLKDLPEQERFTQLRTTKKHFVDTIKLLAYRAETALVQVVREKLARTDDARALVRQVLGSAADLCPDPAAKTLTAQLHRLSSGIHDLALEHLCAELTATETVFPGTDLRLIYEPVGSAPIPRDQEF
ncbi:MAG: hypothetical protein HY854_17085 [Burkholderiales bacterium]|nr:hypothetical protein [Burkholderiales bacterium]